MRLKGLNLTKWLIALLVFSTFDLAFAGTKTASWYGGGEQKAQNGDEVQIGIATRTTLSVKEVLLDKREEECNDIRPRWVSDKEIKPLFDKELKPLIVVFESIGKGEEEYQELSFINLRSEMPSVLPFIKEEFRYEEEDEDFFPSFEKEKMERWYMSYISWIGTPTPTVIFNKGIYEIATFRIDNRKINTLISLEKKIKNGTVYLRTPGEGVSKLFQLKDNGSITGTSTNIVGNDGWQPVVIINGDCSKDKDVVFASKIDGSNVDLLYTFRLPDTPFLDDLSHIRRITNDSQTEMNPKFSPDGKNIVYSSYKDDNMDIYLITDISDDKIRPIQLTTDTTTYECNPTFSPDGKMIAYYSTRDGEVYDLWVMNSNGENKKKIAENVFKTDIYGPCWVPYGTSTLIYIYGTQDKIEMQNVISGEKEWIDTDTGDTVMADIDCIYDYKEKRFFIAYSAIDEKTRRKRIFIKEF